MNDKALQAETGLFRKNGAPIPLQGVEVHGDVAGRGAKVRIRQQFHNAEKKPIEAVYKFPLPESAALCGFRAFVDDRKIEGRIEEREKAFDIYDNALAEGHGAQLLDEERPNLFTLSVGNIKPGSTVVIEIDYVALLDTDGPGVRFYLPTTISPRYTPAHQKDQDGIPVADIVNPPVALSVPYGLKLTVDVHGVGGISSIGSPSHAVNTEFCDGKAVVSFASETAAMDRDFILNISYKEGFSTRGLVCEALGASYVQIDLMPEGESGGDGGNGPAAQREMVFVLDCSGSMWGPSIAEAKKALEILIKALDPGTLFNIYRFGSNYERLFGRSQAYDEKTMKEALDYLQAIDADLGGTEMLAPLQEIYRARLPENHFRDIVLITDGQFSDENSIMDLVRRHADRTALHAVGIGSGPNEFLIKGLARVSGGASAMIAPNERIEPKILRLFKKVIDGPVRNIRVAWDGKVDQAPGDVVAFFGQTTSIFARLKAGSGANARVRITGDTRSGARSWAVPLEPVPRELPIPLLWARETIREIEEGRNVAAGSRQQERRKEKSRQEIIALSRQYGIVSSETSYVGIEKRADADRSTEEMELRKVPVMLTAGWGGVSSSGVDQGAAVFCRVMNPSAVLFGEKDHNLTLSLLQDDTGGSGGTSESSHAYDTLKGPFYSIQSFMKKAHPARRAAQEEDLLLALLSCQQAGGGFAVAGSLLKKVGLAELRGLAKEITIKNKGDKVMLLVTLAVLLVLEMRFEARKGEWESVVMKSRTWLKAEMERAQPTIENQPLEHWLRDYLAKDSGLKQPA